MPYKKNLFAISEEKNDLVGEDIYGKYSDINIALSQDGSLARYAPLSRKVLYQNIKDYNPIDNTYREWKLRYLIKQLMLKYMYDNKPYDREYLDHKFKKVVGILFKVGISYNSEIICNTESKDATDYTEQDFIFRYAKKEDVTQEQTLPLFYYLTRGEWEIAVKARDNYPKLKRQNAMFDFGTDNPFTVYEIQYHKQMTWCLNLDNITRFLPNGDNWKVAKIPVLCFTENPEIVNSN
ncbi:hypothetical protein [Flavobacterium sp. UBA4197]|uniref:hypothetical protein n=1 Tax=Flavobacterium sp. UBA4197 TaxID=1946546 RepID=UPI00257CDDEF|nr:hypothetical protein [Flavobacterium sp. UBA4197]